MSYNATNYTPRRRAKGGERPGKPNRPIAGTKPQGTQKAWTGDIAGRRIRAKSAPARTKNVYPQYGRYTNNPSRTPKPTQRSVSNKSTLARLKKLQTPARAHKFYPQQNRYVSNPLKDAEINTKPFVQSGNFVTVKEITKLAAEGL